MNIVAELKRPLQDFVAISSDALQELIGLLIDLSSKGIIRTTNSGLYSVLDIVGKIADKKSVSETWKRLHTKHPAVLAKCDIWQFSGERQRPTPVTDLAGIIEIIWLLPGDFSNKFRRLGAKVVSDAIASQNTETGEATAALLQAINQLTQVSAEQSKTIAMLSNQIEQLKEMQGATNLIAREYVDVRKFAEERFPGYIDLTDAILLTQKALPPVVVHFTSSEWIEKNAPHLSQRQRICFFKEVAAAHRFLVGCMPTKNKGQYVYSNKHEILFERAKFIAETMIPFESEKPKPALKPFPTEHIALTENEQKLLGKVMRLTVLSKLTGNPIESSNTQFASYLGLYVKNYVKNKMLSKARFKNFYEVTPQLIHVVKEFHQLHNKR